MCHTLIVTLQLAEFVTASGLRVHAHTMDVVTTPTNVTMAATPANFDWLSVAIHEDCWSSGMKRKLSLSDIPELDEPFTYHVTPKSSLYLQMRYNDGNGARKYCRRVVKQRMQNEDSVNMSGVLREVGERGGGTAARDCLQLHACNMFVSLPLRRRIHCSMFPTVVRN